MSAKLRVSKVSAEQSLQRQIKSSVIKPLRGPSTKRFLRWPRDFKIKPNSNKTEVSRLGKAFRSGNTLIKKHL